MKRGLVVLMVCSLIIILSFQFISSASEDSKGIVDSNKNWISCTSTSEGVYAIYYVQLFFGGFPRNKIYKDSCEDGFLKQHYCEGKEPYYKNYECSNCEDNKCISEEVVSQGDEDMESCVKDCELSKCNSILDSEKRYYALEQYSLHCDKNTCHGENCARKLVFFGTFMEGDGTEDDPYQITNCQQLQAIEEDISAHYILKNNINCYNTINWNSGEGFDPIGFYTSIRLAKGDGEHCFIGSLEGDGYVIMNLQINDPYEIGAGLFACTYKAEIKNLGIISSNVNANGVVGGLAGAIYEDTLVDSCFFEGRVIGQTNYLGGISGKNYGTIINTYSSGNVLSNNENFRFVGGLVGFNIDSGIIQNSYSSTNVNSYYSVGGLVGDNKGIVKDCFSSGDVYGEKNVGGLVGSNNGRIINSYYDSFVEYCANNYQDGTVDCYETSKESFKGNVKASEPFVDWDFSDVWKEVEGDYPQLIWER